MLFNVLFNVNIFVQALEESLVTLPGLSYSAKQLLLEMRTLRYDIQLQIYGDIQMADERYNDLAQLARNEVGGNETGTVVTEEKYNKYYT